MTVYQKICIIWWIINLVYVLYLKFIIKPLLPYAQDEYASYISDTIHGTCKSKTTRKILRMALSIIFAFLYSIIVAIMTVINI